MNHAMNSYNRIEMKMLNEVKPEELIDMEISIDVYALEIERENDRFVYFFVVLMLVDEIVI